jgi:hypothetical protein
VGKAEPGRAVEWMRRMIEVSLCRWPEPARINFGAVSVILRADLGTSSADSPCKFLASKPQSTTRTISYPAEQKTNSAECPRSFAPDMPCP